MSISSSGTAPGPRGLPFVGNLLSMWGDVLDFLLGCRARYGDVVRLRLGPMVIHLVAHPEHVRQVLVTNQHNYNKDTRSSAKIRGICGESLLTGNGDFWKHQRRLMQPVFAQHRLAAYTEVMTQATSDLLRRWRDQAPSVQPFNVASEMMRLTYSIVGRAMFGADATGDIASVERAATVVMRHTYRKLEHLINFPLWFPTPGNLRFRKAMRTLDSIVFGIIDERRRAESPQEDVLSRLLRQRDEETSQVMTTQQVRNESITLLLAGHETTANALSWTWYLLATHPEVAVRLRDEVRAVLGDRLPSIEDLQNLRYATGVLQESMRLYPPIWIMERHVVAEDIIGGFRIPAGSTVALSPFVTHRHPEFWPEPETFDPERFTPERIGGRTHQAWFPFGGGQRLCIGSHYAMMEALIITAMIVREFSIELLPRLPCQAETGDHPAHEARAARNTAPCAGVACPG